MKRILFIPFLLLLAAAPLAQGQTCTTATCTAASTSQADFLAALPAPSNTNATVTVNIPSGTSSWTTAFSYTVPAAVTNLTIQGATVVSCSGTAGTSGYICSSTDNTVIEDSFNSTDSLMNISMGGGGASSCFFRMTKLTIEGGTNSSAKNNGILQFNGPCNQFRIDHNNFNISTYSPVLSGFPMRLFGQFEGVIDHNLTTVLSSQITSMVDVWGGINDSTGWGDGSWASPTGFGSSAFLFLEANYMNGGYLEDCYNGGAFVARYNSIINGGPISAVIHSHGTYTPGGRGRSCRAYEAYNNYISGPSPNDDAVFGSTGGPSLVWGNTLATGYNWFAALSTSRNDGSHTETNTPNGWGYCGTAVNSNGVGSGWDGNSPATTGWPCLDGLGRGQGQALNGQYFPNALNSVTGTIAWPQEYLEPVYYFNNTILNGAAAVRLGGTDAQFNRDVYYDCGSLNSSCSGGFTGSAGTGSGVAASRPSTCTAGPGGTYGTSPTGSYGVAYWETDNQQLDICTATNTWTAGVYKPYTYPHPLAAGGSTNTLTVTTTGTGFGTLGNVMNCATGTYSTGQTITCTATPWAGSTFAWTGTGSAPSSSTASTVTFPLNSNSTLTLTFSCSGPCVDQQVTTGTTVGSTIAVSVTSGHSVYIGAFDTTGSGKTITFTDSQSNTWTAPSAAAGTYGALTTNGSAVALACATAGSTGTDTITAKENGTATNMYLTAYDVSSSSCTQDVAAAPLHQSAVTTITSNSATTTLSNDFVMGEGGISAPSTSLIAAGSGWSNPLSAGFIGTPGSTTYYNQFSEARVLASAGAVQMTSGTVPSTEMEGLMVAFNSNPVCGNPTQIGPNYSGTYPAGSYSIGFSSPTPGCNMHMTLDGSTPTCSSTAYAGQTISSTTTMRVIACQTGYVSSAVIGGTWTISSPTTYTFSVSSTGSGSCTFSGTNCANGTYNSGTSISCTASPATGSQFVSWAGTGSASSGTANPNAFTLGANSTLAATCNQIPAATPTASPGTGTYATSQSVTLSDTTAGSTITYCVTSAPPCTPTLTYSTPITISSPPTQYIYAFATASGYAQSPTASFSYILVVPPTSVQGNVTLQNVTIQ